MTSDKALGSGPDLDLKKDPEFGAGSEPDRKAEAAEDPALVAAPVLAFIGDAVYETFVRTYVYRKGLLRADRLNASATAYVRAEAQAYAFDQLLPQLSDKEASVARRGKNHKITSMPKHVDPMIYKKATGFEALIGYLELKGDRDRLEEVVSGALAVIEEKDFRKVKR